MNQRPIFIVGLHKSGTTLLRNLLDHHPELACIPFESHFFQLTGSWVDNEYRRQRPERAPGNPVKADPSGMVEWVRKMNAENIPLADGFVKGKIDMDAFERSMRAFGDCSSRKEQLELYFESILNSLHGMKYSSDQRVVEKSVEHAEFVPEILQMYPQAKFVHILRNPYSNMVSLRKFQTHNHAFPLIYRMLDTMETVYRRMYRNKDLTDNYLIVKYSDLVSDTEKTMRRIAGFLEVDFHEGMLQPTILGEEWAGNSMSKQKFEGVSAARLDAWKSTIHPMEVFYINQRFPFVLRDFGYQKLDMERSFWKPAPKEPFSRYLVNRLYRLYLRHLKNED